ncbi:unnamed protein product [Schistosoma mattheei]|uniref:Uncharacterized protein n=1 Tax=Schistosoma mattheei TaxID=31246 RepID=A0A183NZM4_9TREM|nr:unnamed protein product [Schistosoma mattheei]
MKSRTRVSSYSGLVSRMYLHIRVDIQYGTRTQQCSLQTPSRYPLSYRVLSPKHQWKNSNKTTSTEFIILNIEIEIISEPTNYIIFG